SLWQETGAPAAVTLVARRVTRAWEQGSDCSVYPFAGGGTLVTRTGATWQDASPGVEWSSPGGDYYSVGVTLAKPAGQPPSWHSLDITGMTKRGVSGIARTLGLLLKLDSEPLTAGNYAVYASSESAINPRPKLEVTYPDGSHAQPPQVSLSAPAPDA